MVTTFYPPYNFGGDGIGVQRLTRALARWGHRVTIVHDIDAYNALSSGSEPKPEPEPEGIDVIGLRSGLGLISTLLTHQTGRPIVNRRRIREILDRACFDVISFDNISLIGGPGILSFGEGVKLYTAHEHWLVCPTHALWRHNRELCTGRECVRCVLRYRRPPQLWRYTGYLERQLRHIDIFFARSRFSRDKHHEFGFPREMEVLPYFLPDETPAQRAAGPMVPPHSRPYFLCVGRLEFMKGFDDVIPLFREFPETDLLIAGEGEHGAALQRLARTVPNVKFLGWVPPDQLHRYYHSAEALIVPSVSFETFGIVLIEAFRASTPVIARRIGPLPEIVEECGAGLLFTTTQELVAAMKNILLDPDERARMSRRARRGFLDRWSESAVVPRYLEFILRAAEHKQRADIVERLRPGNDVWSSRPHI